MAGVLDSLQARTVFLHLCAYLDGRKWAYEKYEEDLTVAFSVKVNDTASRLVIVADAECQTLRLLSRLPISVPVSKKNDIAIATCAASFWLSDGCFEFDYRNGYVDYRLTAMFTDSVIGDGLFSYLIERAAVTIDKHLGKFLSVSDGTMSVRSFLTQCELD